MSDEWPDDLFPQLKETSSVPWQVIQEFARDLPGQPELFADVTGRLDDLMEDPWEDMDLEFTYLCAILALAAPNLSPLQRTAALVTLRKGVVDTAPDEESGDLSEDAVRSALAALGEPLYQESRTVEEWVRQYHHAFNKWAKEMDKEMEGLAEQHGLGIFDDQDDDEEADDEEADDERVALELEKLVEAFTNSPRAAALPEGQREDAGGFAMDLCQFLSDYFDADPGELTQAKAREVFLEIIPRKVTADRAYFEEIAPIDAAFVRFLGDEGKLKGAEAIASWIEKNASQIVDACMDESNWGPAKSMAMLAAEEGVDLTDERAMNRFMFQYNARLLAAQPPEPEMPMLDEPVAPIRTETPKVGRNDPCPCGSGKKYKKCCGK